ncbi:MAG TPA: DUF924 family protein [bacterium]|nr:DUF924 family protein [bacterium]
MSKHSLEDVLHFWFGNIPVRAEDIRPYVDHRMRLWFAGTPEIDAEIRKRFEKDLLKAALGDHEEWMKTARGKLALVVLFDQFPRNIYRDQPRGIWFDPLAREIAFATVSAGQDRDVPPLERAFLYLPYEHSEELAVQNRGVELFTRLVNEVSPDWKPTFENFRRYAELHRDMIARFGRFPDRNEMLGRVSTAEEIEVLRDYPF